MPKGCQVCGAVVIDDRCVDCGASQSAVHAIRRSMRIGHTSHSAWRANLKRREALIWEEMSPEFRQKTVVAMRRAQMKFAKQELVRFAPLMALILAVGFGLGIVLYSIFGWPAGRNGRLVFANTSMITTFAIAVPVLGHLFSRLPGRSRSDEQDQIVERLMEVASLLYRKSRPPWYLKSIPWVAGLTMLVELAGIWLFF